MSTHTPTPWRIEVVPLTPGDSIAMGALSADAPGGGMATSYRNAITAIVGADGRIVCHDAEYYSQAPTAEDMALIVISRNAHESLVEALKMMIRLADGGKHPLAARIKARKVLADVGCV